MRSLPGAERWSRALHHVSGLSARWGSVCGWVMYPLWEDDHLGVAIETPAPAKGRSPSAAASFQPPSEGPLCRRQHLSLLVAEGDPLRLPPLPHRSNSLHPSGAVEPVVGGVPSPSRPPPRGAAKPRARGPRTGDPEMIGTALQEMVTAPLLPPEEGRVVNPLFFPSVPPLAQQPAVPKFSIKEQFLSSPGSKRARRVVGGAKPLHSHPPLLSPADSSAQFEMGTQASPAPLVRPWNQVSVAQHTQTPLRAASKESPPSCVPAFHLAAPLRVRRWSPWSHLCGLCEPG